MSVLSGRDLSVSYGGVQALRNVDLDVGPGELVGLIGPNGAGKTTFIDAVSGFAASTGKVELAGNALTGLQPHERARRGLSRTWQSIELFDSLSVAENVAVGAPRRSPWSLLRDTVQRPQALPPQVGRALTALDLQSRADALATDLSQGERKLVGVARALAAEPALICLDEPAAGLDSEASAWLGRRLRAAVATRLSKLLEDHDMDLVLDVCDTVVVLEFGRVIAAGPPQEVRADPRVVAAYLGSHGKEIVATTGTESP
jgi:branched-chain amino acid transport system ATP-binding protein